MKTLEELVDAGYRVTSEKGVGHALIVISRPGESLIGPHGVKAAQLVSRGQTIEEAMIKTVNWLEGRTATDLHKAAPHGYTRAFTFLAYRVARLFIRPSGNVRS